MENNNKPSEISPHGARYASSTPMFNTSNRRSVPPEVSDHYTMTNQLNPSELQHDCNYYGGHTEIAKYAGMANNVNLMEQMSQNAGYYNNHGSVSNENLNMGRSYHQSFFNDGMNGSDIPFTQLLLMGNAAFTASANSNLSTSIGMAAKRPLLPKLSPIIHSDGENNNNSWLTDQNYNSSSGMISTVDKRIIPEVHSQIDSRVRDSNQSHYSSSTCLNNEVSQFLFADSYLTPFQPGCDLNSTEIAESDAFSSVCNPLQFTPITPNKAITIPEKEGSLVPHKGDETIEQAHSNQLLESVVDSSCAIIHTPTMETTDDDKKISMGVDLNRTPELKPAKRRKHRPKVIVEGKPKRTPKTATSKTKEPKQNSTSKRKYARKDGSKDPRTPKPDVARKTKERDGASASKSCRRVLDFDIKKSGENKETIFNEQELQQKSERALNMTLDSQATELPNGTDCVIRVMSVPQSGTHKKLMMDNQKTTNASMTSPLMKRIFSDCTSMLEREAASPPSAATEDIQTNDQIFLRRHEKNKKAKQPWNTWRNGYKPMVQEKHAELLTGVLENNCQNLEKEKQLKTLPNSFQPETAGGENTDSINTKNPLGSLLCKGVLEMNNHRNGCTQRAQFSQTYKRRKTRIDYTNSYIKPSNFTAAKNLGKVQINRSNSGCQNLHALMTDPAVLNCHFESIRTPQRRNNMVNKLMNESYFQSITSTDDANQQVSTQLQLHTNVRAPPTSSHFYDISYQPITEKCNNLQPSHSIGQGHSQPYQNCNNNVPVEKQTGEMLQEQIAPCGNQRPFKKIRGRKKQQIQPMSIDIIIHLFKNLSLNEISNRRQMQEYGILVPYKGDSAMVPYEGFEFNKKRKARPKVDLDPETDRIWKLLMGSGVEGTNKDKEKWWEEERKVFHGRVDSFIARMHLVQGDRRFSRWKGSVVDSVIGVFLTQNVSDHLSSSAFMSMAARFPLKSTSTSKEDIRANELNKKAEICVIHQDDTTEKQENLSDVIHNQKSIIPSESSGHQSKETSETDRSLLESQCQSLQEEFISSQDSFDSRNSQSIGGIRSCSGSNSEAEDPSTIVKPTQNNVSSAIDFLEMRKITNFGEHYCHNNSGCKNGQSEVGPLKSGSERTRHLNYLPSFMYSTSLDHQCMNVPVDPTTKNELSMKQKIQVTEMGCFETFSEESTTSSPSNSSTLIKAKEKDLNIISRQDFDVSSAEQNRLWGSQEMPTKDRYGLLSKDATEKKRMSQQHESQNECIGYGDFKLKNATMEPRKLKRTNVDKEKMDSIDWDNLRKQVEINGPRKETENTMDSLDSLDYEAVRCAHVKEISDAIKERGMNNRLAERMQEFLNRLVRDHGSINLEWLRDVPPDKAKDYLLSMRGLGLKSVECVRLLTLHHVAFPVDTNVGRIAVRLGWVPLQPLPESLQLHLLELYPILETIQKYLWPRLCKLDQRTLYELHYQMITFGKVFCTKSKPNCNACPMRAECRHFASAFASARLALPGPEEKRIIHTTVPVAINKTHASTNLMSLPPPEKNSLTEANSKIGTCEPIIEEPATPEEEHTEISERDIEDLFYEDPDEIPTIKLNIEEFSVTLQNYMHNSMEIQEGDFSKALVALNQEAASIPTPKLKNISRLRTEHQVYELPDSHPILEGLERREPDDPSPYLLAIWVPGETVNSIEPPERTCDSQETGILCSEKTCFSCSSVREADSQTVRATILIPCRTAMRGSFPLNGTYFQVNEMFADHDSSLNPINVPRQSIWNLPRRTVYFGTSVSSIFRGLSTEAIQYCFWRGFVCVRGFDRMTRAPRPLIARLHFPASKLAKAKHDNKK